MNRTELTQLHKNSRELFAKVKRNSQKLAWMDATRRMGAEVISFEQDLAKYETEYQAAAKKFRDGLGMMNWETDQIVEFLTEVGA